MAAQGNGNNAPTAPSEADARQGTGAGAGSFEAAAQRLGNIVDQLEADDLSLEQAIALFEEGVRVNQQAQARLDEAEKRVEELLAIDPQGEPRTRAFESGADDNE